MSSNDWFLVKGNKEQSLSGSSVIGRGIAVDLYVPHESCSREHARFSVVGGRAFITDLDSTHGTHINGVRLNRGKQSPLNPGDQITFGYSPAYTLKAKTFSVKIQPSKATPTSSPASSPAFSGLFQPVAIKRETSCSSPGFSGLAQPVTVTVEGKIPGMDAYKDLSSPVKFAPDPKEAKINNLRPFWSAPSQKLVNPIFACWTDSEDECECLDDERDCKRRGTIDGHSESTESLEDSEHSSNSVIEVSDESSETEEEQDIVEQESKLLTEPRPQLLEHQKQQQRRDQQPRQAVQRKQQDILDLDSLQKRLDKLSISNGSSGKPTSHQEDYKGANNGSCCKEQPGRGPAKFEASKTSIRAVIDTNSLLETNLNLFKNLYRHRLLVSVVIPHVVMRELDGLKSRANLGNSAREAIRTIHNYLSMEQENCSSGAQTQWLELQPALERSRGHYHLSADEEVLRACETEMRSHQQVVLITDDINLQARALSRKVPTDSLNSFLRAINAFYSNYSKYGDGLSAQIKMREGHISLATPNI